MVYAGLRSGEIRGLEAGDIDLGSGVVRVVRTLSEDEEQQPKGDKERIVPVVPQLAEILGPGDRREASARPSRPDETRDDAASPARAGEARRPSSSV